MGWQIRRDTDASCSEKGMDVRSSDVDEVREGGTEFGAFSLCRCNYTRTLTDAVNSR
jgi:hypothetical protein